MLCRIVTESVCTVTHEIFNKISLHICSRLILGIYVPQTRKLAVSNFITIVPIGHIAVVAVMMVVTVILPAACNRGIIRSHMISNDINNDSNAVLVSFRAHILKILLGSHNPVSDSSVRRLIYEIPVFGKHHAETGMNGRNRLGLNRSITGFCNLLHVVLNGIE